MFCIALAAVALSTPPGPVAAVADFPSDKQWAAVAACPRVVARTGSAGTATGVTVGVRDGFAYVLTAAHAVPEADDREAHYFTAASYPARARTCPAVAVVARFTACDVALLKVPLGKEPVPVAKLAAPGKRPKAFPFAALSVGCTDAAAPTCRAEVVRAKRLVRRPGDAVAFFWESAAVPTAGRSGGPLFDAAGAVVGICSAAQDGNGYYTHVDEIHAALTGAGFAWLWAE